MTGWFEDIDYCPSNKVEKIFLDCFPNSTAHSPETLVGMNLSFIPEAIELLQPGLICKGLEMLGLTDCRSVKNPLTLAFQLHTATEEDHPEFSKLNINYRS
ncbi:hypothetical protein VP01_3621g1, partial [Puccinia sorghi]